MDVSEQLADAQAQAARQLGQNIPQVPADQRLRAELHREYDAAAKSAEACRASLEVWERVMAACVAALEHFEDQSEAPDFSFRDGGQSSRPRPGY